MVCALNMVGSLAYTGLGRMNIDIPVSTQVIMMVSPSKKGAYQMLTWVGNSNSCSNST